MVAMAFTAALRSYAVALLVIVTVMPHIAAQEECATNLLEAVRSQPSLSILASVVEAAGLSEQLSSLDNVTVLAPDNNAFNGTNGLLSILAANNLTLEDVTAPGSNRAASILLYHIIPTPATAAALTDGQTLPTALGDGFNLIVDKTTTPTVIVSFIGTGSNATVIAADIPVCNSIVHVVNTVLLPAQTLGGIPTYGATPPPVMAPVVAPAPVPEEEDGGSTQCNTTLLEVVRSLPDLSILADVIEAAGLSALVNMTDNVTVIAPDNNAFNGTNGLLSILAANNLTLEQVTAPGSNRAASILLYHIVTSPATAADLTNGQTLPTALGNGYDLTVEKSTTPTVIVSFVGEGSNATVITADLRVCNSIVHIVNNVLLPATTLTAIPIQSEAPTGAPVQSPEMAPAPTEEDNAPGASSPSGSVPAVGAPAPEATNAAPSLTVGSVAFALSAAVALAMNM